MDDFRQALRDPLTVARVDALITDFEDRSVRLLPLNVIACLTDAGLDSDHVALLAEAVLARVAETGGVDKFTVEVERPRAATVTGSSSR